MHTARYLVKFGQLWTLLDTCVRQICVKSGTQQTTKSPPPTCAGGGQVEASGVGHSAPVMRLQGTGQVGAGVARFTKNLHY